jgi:hypothetical protein
MVWLYPIQFCAKLTPMECHLDLCTSMQKHHCINFEEVPPTLAPFLVVI